MNTIQQYQEKESINKSEYSILESGACNLTEAFFQGETKETLPREDLEDKLLEFIDIGEKENGGKDFNIEFPKKYKKEISEILGDHHPLFWMNRLKERDQLFNVTFRELKLINTKVGDKEKVNKPLHIIQDKIIDYIQWRTYGSVQNNGNTKNDIKKVRTVRRDFKILTLAFNQEEVGFPVHFTPENLGLEKGNGLNDFLDFVLREGVDQDTINTFKMHFKIEVGNSEIKSDKIEDKVIAVYKAEKSGGMPNSEFNFSIVEDRATQLEELEKKIEKTYGSQEGHKHGLSFNVGGVNFPIILNNKDIDSSPETEHPFGSINPILISVLRANEELILSKQNNIDIYIQHIKKYMEILNHLDFIPPYILSGKKIDYKNLSNFIDLFKEIQKYIENIETQYENKGGKGICSSYNIKHTYKGTLTKKAFARECEGKKGLRIFMDIAKMGDKNLAESRILNTLVQNGTINEKEFYNLLHAGMGVSQTFKQLTIKIKGENKKVLISLYGGDEGYMLFPNVEPGSEEESQIITSISKSLSDEGLSARIAHSYTDDNQVALFNRLDSITGLVKPFEKYLRVFNRRFQSQPFILAHVTMDNSLQEKMLTIGKQYWTDVSKKIQNMPIETFTAKDTNRVQKTKAEIESLEIQGVVEDRRQNADRIIDYRIELFTIEVEGVSHIYFFEKQGERIIIDIQECFQE